MNSRLVFLGIALAIATAALPVQSFEGRVELFASTTITQAGSYIVTKDIVVAGAGVAITIDADNVLLDLNGHTLRGASGSAGLGVRIKNGRSGLTIQNGRIVNFAFAIIHSDSAADIAVTLRDLQLSAGIAAIELRGLGYVRIDSCVTSALGDQANKITLAGQRFSGEIRDSSFFGTVSDGTITLTGFESGLIQGNNVVVGGSVTAAGGPFVLRLSGGGRNRILDNTVSYGGVVCLDLNQSSDNIVLNNVINSCQIGVQVSDASRNLLQENLISGHQLHPLEFNAGSSDNAYRGNILRGNGSNLVADAGTNNTDGGNL